MSSALIAAHDLGVDAYDGGSLIIEIAKDGTALYAKLAQIRDAVFFAAAAVTLLFVLIALALLEKTAISPLRALTGQMRRLRQDESQLGKRVEVMGNAEVAEVAQGFNEMTAKIEKLYENLEHMAFTDPLTQLPNRSLFQERLEQAIAHAQREHQTFALFIMDLDRFKEINDTLGHHIGDLLLQQVAVRLRGKLREIDTLARMGGDEFAVLLPAVTAKQADMAARMLLQSLRTPFVVEGNQLDVRTSIGVALYPDHGVDVNLLTQRADVAMYAAKQSGSGHTFYDEQMDRHHPALLTLMGELRQAVEQEQFVLYFQPKIGLGGNHVVGVEALVRWRHPSGRLIMPETFIPLLEQTGLIRSLTGWVINEALRVGRELRSEGFALPIAVNISARDLQNSCLVEELGEQLAAHQADAHWLELEITESAVMADVEGAVEVLTRLATMGFILVIDDFGTGHSSLAYLKRLPVHIVKIDKSFVHGMARDTNDAAIVYTSIELTHNLGLQVVAEGVDDETVLARLRTHGCDAVQGLYLSRPLSHEELTDWLVKSSWGLPTRLAS
jgi:diguanylate cyclase (GGDEF)-like protein